MNETQVLYYDGILPAYQRVLEALIADELDAYSLRFKYSQLFNYLNDCIDYLAQEHGSHVQQRITAKNDANLARDLREALTSGHQKSLPLAYVRDIANVSKHAKISRHDKVVGNVSELKETI